MTQPLQTMLSKNVGDMTLIVLALTKIGTGDVVVLLTPPRDTKNSPKAMVMKRIQTSLILAKDQPALRPIEQS